MFKKFILPLLIVVLFVFGIVVITKKVNTIGSRGFNLAQTSPIEQQSCEDLLFKLAAENNLASSEISNITTPTLGLPASSGFDTDNDAVLDIFYEEIEFSIFEITNSIELGFSTDPSSSQPYLLTTELVPENNPPDEIVKEIPVNKFIPEKLYSWRVRGKVLEKRSIYSEPLYFMVCLEK